MTLGIMESNYRSNISKWLPSADPELQKWFESVSRLTLNINEQVKHAVLILKDIEMSDDLATTAHRESLLDYLMEHLKDIIMNTTNLMCLDANNYHPIYQYKILLLLHVLKSEVTDIAKFTEHLLTELVDCASDQYLRIIFKLMMEFNKLLDLECHVIQPEINLFSNDCPPMLQPLRKMSLTFFFQILAKNHAEQYCHTLIDCLLANYRLNNAEQQLDSPKSTDIEVSENSSIEIYRALTKHMTPAAAAAASAAATAPPPPPPVVSMNHDSSTINDRVQRSNIENIDALVNKQLEHVNAVLSIAVQLNDRLLLPSCIKIQKGLVKMKKSGRLTICNYYEELAWGSISNILDHVILWWSPECLAPRHSQGAQQLKDWLHQLIQGITVAPSVRLTLQNLCDALGCHVTITEWDQLFRLAYIASFESQSISSSSLSPPPCSLSDELQEEEEEEEEEEQQQGTETGRIFIEIFQLLMTLSNECEIGGEWVVGAPLLELPLSEQIIVLHRLDHSIHSMRMWTIQESKIIAHTWDLDNFFHLVKRDVIDSLEELSYLKLADHGNVLAQNKDGMSVQVYVCAKMRAKIVSEVNANIQLLKGSPGRCIETLAAICRLICLANLHMCFPSPSYWRSNASTVPQLRSDYVDIYFKKMLLPVLEVIDDYEISNMILKIMCEAWLDYIYLHGIKFSERGAIQLLTDFAFVTAWLTKCPVLTENVRGHLLKNEVLRRCEGVGRLLLRHPGEPINMNKQQQVNRGADNESPKSLGLERMPAEMYVPNQEQWLELRASKEFHYCCIHS